MYLESLEAYGQQLIPVEHIIAFATSAELELSETVWINSWQLWILHNSFIHVPVKGIKILESEIKMSVIALVFRFLPILLYHFIFTAI